MMKLDDLNNASAADFVALLDGTYEHSPWIAQEALAQRPFRSLSHLKQAMADIVRNAGPDRQLALIRAHPELAGKAAIRGELTEASSREQSGAGLDRCTPEEYARLHALNAEYGRRFGFPFILAVRGYDRAGILAQLERRLANARDAELGEALRQIGRIARFRLNDLLGG